MKRFIAGVVFAVLLLPPAAHAQGGAPGGAVDGYHKGEHIAGPIGGILGAAVGGIVGGVVGGVSGVLGVPQNAEPREPPPRYRHGRRHRRDRYDD